MFGIKLTLRSYSPQWSLEAMIPPKKSPDHLHKALNSFPHNNGFSFNPILLISIYNIQYITLVGKVTMWFLVWHFGALSYAAILPVNLPHPSELPLADLCLCLTSHSSLHHHLPLCLIIIDYFMLLTFYVNPTLFINQAVNPLTVWIHTQLTHAVHSVYSKWTLGNHHLYLLLSLLRIIIKLTSIMFM